MRNWIKIVLAFFVTIMAIIVAYFLFFQAEENYPLNLNWVLVENSEKTIAHFDFSNGNLYRESRIRQLSKGAEVGSGNNLVLFFKENELSDHYLIFEIQEYRVGEALEVDNKYLKIYYKYNNLVFKLNDKKDGSIFIAESTGEMIRGDFNIAFKSEDYNLNLDGSFEGNIDSKG